MRYPGSKKIWTTVLVVVAVTILVVLGFQVRTGATADSVAVLQTSGMTCSSCSNQISGALSKLRGVAVTEVDINGGFVIVGYDTKRVKPEELAEKVQATGFGSRVYAVITPEQFRQVTGRNIGQNGQAGGGCGCGSKKKA